MEKNLIISKLIFIKFYLLKKELNDDIRKIIYIEMRDYYKQLLYKFQINKIINYLNFAGRCYYIKSKKKIIYIDYMNNIIKFQNFNIITYR